jgi:amidase
MTVKDSWQTAGMRTTSGAPELAEFAPEVDAWPVARLRAAGAVIYGKTNLPKYAGDFQTYNEVFGTTNNPFDGDRTPGGSSGGSAAALSCGFTPLELGSDIGGSIRLPAHMSGVMGHKPSYGVVPAHGQLGLDILAGPDRWNTPAWRLELPPPRSENLRDYRIGAWLDDERCPVEPEVHSLLEAAATKLAREGAVVDPHVRPAFTLDKAADTFFTLLQSALSGSYPRHVVERLALDTGETARATTGRRIAIRHREWLSANERRLQMRLRWEELFSAWDVVLMPVMPCAAIPHDHREPMVDRTVSFSGRQWPYWDAATWMAPAGACYLPATVVPVGVTASGLPVGIQIVGPYLNDRTTLDVARHLAELVGGCPRPPGF